MKLVALPLLVLLASHGSGQPPPRDQQPPAANPATPERALLDAAAADPTSAVAHYNLVLFYWEAVRAPDVSPELGLRYILNGIAAADRALAIKPDYLEAMTYKNVLLRRQAIQSTDPAEQKRLMDEADALRARVMGFHAAAARRRAEAFDEAMARLRPVRVGGNIRVPAKVKHVKPVLPADARAMGTVGSVIIETIVGDDGKIVDTRVVKSIPALAGAAMDAVRQWEYAPTLVNGRAVSVVMPVTVTFTLQ